MGSSPDFDLVVRGGTVFDGTGAPGREADVAVSGGKVAAVGRVSGRGAEEVDARGLMVAPGWVDIHSHYDGQATWTSELSPSSWLGVTTTVMGNCGVGFAPAREEHHQTLLDLMEGVEDIPGAVLSEGVTWGWETFPEFLDVLERRPHDIDFAAQVPHGPLRVYVMGERGAAAEPATPDEVRAMGRLAREAIAAGALGFTTSRTLNHKTKTGGSTPTVRAAADELIGIAEEVGAGGRGVFQMISDFPDFEGEWQTLRQMVVRSGGRPLSMTVSDPPGLPTDAMEMLGHLAAANADGLPITGQVAPRSIGLLLGLNCTLHPFMTNPVYMAEVAGRPAPEQARLLADPDRRRRLLAACDGVVDRTKLGGAWINRWAEMFPLGNPPDYEPPASASVAARAAATGARPEEVALDVICGDDGAAFLYLPVSYAAGSLDRIRSMLVHPNTVPALGDGGAHAGTICDASFATFYLTHWGRDRPRGRLPVEWIVEQQCHAPARYIGLGDRGVLAPGYRADLNVIDFDSLVVHPPEVHADLPAGGRRLLQRATGYRHTFVAGVETYRDGKATGALPGQLVRGARPAPA